MKAEAILDLEPKLIEFLNDFEDCIPAPPTREHMKTYVEGQLSDLPRKSVEPIALAAGKAPRTLQEFLNLHSWDQDMLRDKIEGRIVERHQSNHSIGIVDETGCPKKGDKTPGVQRQWCGATGKTDNCVVTVHLNYTADDFHALLDSDLFLPESWAKDRKRCEEAHIPATLTYRPKWKIALELYAKARENGVTFEWLTFDEGYGGKPEFLEGLMKENQPFIAEVPKTFSGWANEPIVSLRGYGENRAGRRRKIPRVRRGEKKANPIKKVKFTDDWKRWYVKDTTLGPLVWEEKHALFYMKGSDGLPSEPLELIRTRNCLKLSEEKFFVVYNPRARTMEELILVAFSRWHVERCFEDEKTELGFDHFEGRSYLGMMRHQRLTALTHLFLSEVTEEYKKKLAFHYSLPSQDDERGPRANVAASRSGLKNTA